MPLQFVKSLVFSWLRREDRVVLLTPPNIGVGNFLYIWLQAAILRDRGIDAWALHTAPMEGWLAQFPKVRELLVEPANIDWRASRRHGYFQGHGYDFDDDSLSSFTDRYLLSRNPFVDSIGQYSTRSDTVVINIRRGDYYSVPELRGNYSFDVSEFIHSALPLHGQEPERVVLVSDDPDWCRIKLSWLAELYDVEWPRLGEEPSINLARLAGAERLVLANSTFSYWGGYMSMVRSSEAVVVCPAFHARHIGGGRTFHAMKRWTIVEDIPGGWDG